jgi:peroxisomal coenzyme A diphosphatase NUDT7
MNIDSIKDSLSSDGACIIGEDTEYKRYSVLIPLVIKNNEAHIVFEVRASHLRNQPGEISFPGGKIEKNENPLDAAVRETCEELGTEKANIEVMGQTAMLITHHNKIIYPFVGFVKKCEEIKPSEDEVDHEFYVPVKYFIENDPVIKRIRLLAQPDEDLPFMEEGSSVNYKMAHGKADIYFYKYDDYIIWGLTAKILYHFIKLIKLKGF